MSDLLPPIECGGCRKCCQGDTITLMGSDDPEAFKTDVVDGRHVLQKRIDGSCVYLAKDGCSIYERQPTMCRVFDCRGYYLSLEGDPEALASRLARSQNRAPLLEGRWRVLRLRGGH